MPSHSRSRGPDPIRFARFALFLSIVLAAAPARAAGPVTTVSSAPAGSAAAGWKAVRTVAQDQRGATFDVVPAPARFDSMNVNGALYARVSLPGGVVVEQPGKPALPTLSLYVAVPDGMSPRLRVTAEQWADRAGLLPLPVAHERFRSDDPVKGPMSEFRTEPDPAVYRAASPYPADAAALGPGALVGEWWVAPVHVHPIRWDPRAAAYRVLEKMTIRVDFIPATDRELAGRPAVRPGAQARPWDRVQRGLVQNYESARSFPARPRSGAAGAGGLRAGGSRLAVNPEWKLSIGETGWVSVSYASLAASGFPSGIAIATVRVEERGYDDIGDSATVTVIPVVPRDNNGNGTFDAGDAVTFYARSLRDRMGLGNIELKYSLVNVYWLTWGSAPSPRPAPIAGDIPGTPDTPVSFQDVIRLEENRVAFMFPNSGSTPKPEAIEHLFWTDGQEGDQVDIPIPFVDPDPAQSFRIRARYQGKTNGIVHRLDLLFRGASGLVDTLALDAEFMDQDVFVFDSGFTIPGSHIGPGPNSYQHVGDRYSFANPTPLDGSYAFLDVVEATYYRRYVARNNYLRFSSGPGGLVEIHVAGFTGGTPPRVDVYDVTDPLAPDSVTSVVVSSTGSTWEAVFRTDASGGERRFVAFVPGAEQGVASVVSDAPSALRSPGAFGSANVARAILVTPQSFRAEVDRLAEYRRAQGYVVEVADIVDIYDEFNGGLKSPRAIRRYLRHGWLTWTPRPMYVTLVGDGTLDYRGELAGSSTDWVPTYFKFSTIPDGPGYELVSQDPYYSLNLAFIEPLPSDFIPSVSLTRIPAGSPQETRDVVDKIIAYESFAPADSWRGRQLLFSDDEYSTGITGTGFYCFNPQEILFKLASEDMANTTASSPGGIGILNVPFDLKTYTDAVPPSSGCKNLVAVATKLAEPNGGYDQLMNAMNQGALIFNLETHANRFIIAHETVLSNGSVFAGTLAKNTPDRIQNVGRPWYAMVWGCHTSQFSDYPLARGGVDSVDALGEQWLTMNNRGAIASLGSSALEYLQFNTNYNQFVASAFYETPPAPAPPPGEPAQARWILGEVMLQAQIRNGMTGNESNPQSVMNRTVHLFADPMLRMDALPPRVADVTLGGVPFADNAALTTDSPTDSMAVVAQIRDEVGIDSVYVTEQNLGTGAVTPVDPGTYTVTFSDSSRVANLTGNVRPHVGNYDLQLRAVDVNGRLRIFTMQVRTPIRYLANGVEIVNNVFVESGALLRAEVTSPIPLTADSLTLRIDGAPAAATKTKLDAAGRQWALEFTPVDLFTGSHRIEVAIGGRTDGLDFRTFQTTTEFTLRGVAVVDSRIQGAGCGGSIFQYELSAAARKVDLAIYSVAGRRIASIDLPGQAGFNLYCWDGRDSRAHDTAQGVYLYRLRATGTDGKTVSRDGRMIRVR